MKFICLFLRCYRGFFCIFPLLLLVCANVVAENINVANVKDAISNKTVAIGPYARSVTSAKKVSDFGVYRGYSKRQYNSYIRDSKYIAVRDGTRLALDIYHPAVDGKRADKKLPIILMATRYWRGAQLPNGEVTSDVGGSARMEDENSEARYLLEHGYIIGVVDVRGTGASFGRVPDFYEMSVETGRDLYDVIEWLARQKWSSGSVGMIGVSFLGVTQLWAAASNPPSLKAIFTGGVSFDSTGLL